jgi:hypothetical protein
MSGKRDPRLNAYVKVDKWGAVVAGTLVIRKKQPGGSKWLQITSNVCCTSTSTTTTTS